MQIFKPVAVRPAPAMMALFASTALLTPGVALAAEDEATASSGTTVGEVVVTARRVEEDLQNVPIAITALSEEQLERQGITDPIQLQFAAPSLQSGTTYNRLVGGYTVRGIPGTGSYFAEVPGGPTAIPSAPLYDMKSIQVLIGPQGTLFGRSSIAGAVLFEPARPDLMEFSAEVGAGAGSLGMFKATGVVNIPLIEDQLAIRIAANRYHLNGFTEVLQSGERLNETNNFAGRLSVLWRPGDGQFSNYTLLDYVGVRQASSGWVLRAYNPNLAVFKLPANIDAPNGLTAGTAAFGTYCTAAVSAGIQSSFNGCIDQRLRVASSFLPALQSEMNRIERGGKDALRFTGGPANAGFPLKEFFNQYFLVNQTEYDFGDLGFTTLSVKNIFGMTSSNGSSGWQIDGIGGALFSAISGGGGNFSLSNSANQASRRDAQAVGYFAHSPYVKTYTNELQVRGEVGEDLVSWSLGGFYSKTPIPKNLTGIRNIARTNGGIYNNIFGFVPSFLFQNGGHYQEKAVYGQATVDLSRLAPMIEGLHFTGGLRKTWSEQINHQVRVQQDLASGLFLPGGPGADLMTKSDGKNRTLSLDAQITPNLLVYATSRTAYLPGGNNTVVGAEQIFPNYRPSFDPTTVKDYEVGFKADFSLGDTAFRFNADAFRLNYKDIQQTIFASGGGITATFVVNAAAARMQGVELQAQALRGPWQASATYSYIDSKFTRWEAPDPLGLITVGNPRCLADSPALQCYIDLSNSAFPNIPKHKLGLTVTRTFELPDDNGEVALTAAGAWQSLRYIGGIQSTRNIEAFGPVIGEEPVKRSQTQAAYGILNLRAEWNGVMGSPVTIAAFANNVFDKTYAISSLSVLQSLGTAAVLYGDPRVVGVEFKYGF